MSDSDYPEDMNLTIVYMSGLANGKEYERERIVMWLEKRGVEWYVPDTIEADTYLSILDDIKAGEHLK